MLELKYDEPGTIVVRENRRVLWYSMIVIILMPFILSQIITNRIVFTIVLLISLSPSVKDLIRFFFWRLISTPLEITIRSSLGRILTFDYHEIDQVKIKRSFRGLVTYHLHVNGRVVTKIPENLDGAKEFLMQLPKKQIPFYVKEKLVQNFDVRNF